MASAVVAGALTPAGYEFVAELAAQSIPTIALGQVPKGEEEMYKQRFQFRKSRLDPVPWSAMNFMQLIANMRPSHIVSVLPANNERVMALKLRGVPEGNWEEDNFKYTDMLIDAVAKAQHDARIVYISAVGASLGAKEPALQAMARAEQKIRIGGMAHTIVHAPPLNELSWGGFQAPFKLARSAKDLAWTGLGLFNAEARRNNKTLSPRRLARAVIDHAFSEAAENAVLEPRDVR